ncbi:MAG: histidine--tRNA ligase [Candidatus Woesebacteria bacterium]
MNQPQVLKGFRDFLPRDIRAREYVMGKIKQTFKQFGFESIETPTIEYKSTIMGKYGEEADKLVYAFTDNGDREVALRYDQTVPTARFIANNFNEISFPFRRYQTQNVFRADKPQKGRYREFTQCDIDIFGSSDPTADAEILACTYAAYKAIGFQTIQILVNDRQTLVSVLKPYETDTVSVFSIIQTIDKMDKLPKDEVIAELVRKGMTNVNAVDALTNLLAVNPSANLEQIMSLAEALGVSDAEISFEPTLARGLDYYTGMIFEVKIPEFAVGSVGAGGRYDNLIEQLSGVEMSAVGMAVGFDRTVDAAIQFDLIPTALDDKKVLVTVFDAALIGESASVTKTLREQGLSVELYPKFTKLDKQFKYADKKGIRYCIVIGSQEVENNQVMLKDLSDGKQELLNLDALVEKLK